MIGADNAADVAKVAAGLTKAGKRWMAGKGAGAKCTKRLQEMGLIKPYGDKWWEMTETGLAVRAHLAAQENARD